MYGNCVWAHEPLNMHLCLNFGYLGSKMRPKRVKKRVLGPTRALFTQMLLAFHA